MARYSFVDELYMAHSAEYERRLERYMHNLRADCRRSGGYDRYKRDSRKYFIRHFLAWRKVTGRTLCHINNDQWATGLIYTVVNGKVTGVRRSKDGE